jgi:hypothetical protein
MNSRITKTAALLTAFYFSSCKCSEKTIDCPGFDGKDLKEWFTYSDNQQIRFRTSAGNQEIFNLKNTSTTQPYQATGSWQNTVSCGAEQVFESVEKDSFNAKFRVVLTEADNMVGNASINVFKSNIVFEQFTKDSVGSAIIDYLKTYLLFNNSVMLDNKTFSNVYEARRDTTDTKKPGIYKAYIAKQQGLVAFVEYPSLKVWVKQ